jgi:hypothetical protein
MIIQIPTQGTLEWLQFITKAKENTKQMANGSESTPQAELVSPTATAVDWLGLCEQMCVDAADPIICQVDCVLENQFQVTVPPPNVQEPNMTACEKAKREYDWCMDQYNEMNYSEVAKQSLYRTCLEWKERIDQYCP